MPRRDKAVYTKAIDKKGDYEIYSTKSKQLLGKIKGVNDNRNSYWEALDTDGNCMFQGGRKKECLNYFCDLEEKRLMAKGGNVEEITKEEWKSILSKFLKQFYGDYEDSTVEDYENEDSVTSDQAKDYWANFTDKYKTEKEMSVALSDFLKSLTEREKGLILIKKGAEKYADAEEHDRNKIYSTITIIKKSKAENYAKGGGIGFEKLSNKVAKNYEGDKVAPEYQGEYGKTYSRKEAQEVGDKVAGKVYWQQRGRKFGEGGEMENLDYRISKAIYKAYGNIDDAIEFREYYTGHGISPYKLVLLAVRKGWITPEEINKDVLNSAYETSSETEGEEEIGSSDTNHYVWSMLRDAGFDMKISNGSYVRANGKMSTGGEVDDDDCGCDDDEYATGGSMSSSPKTYYIILNDGSKKEFNVKHPKEINGIYFAMGYDRGADSIAKGTPMVHFENALNPLYNADGTPAEAMPQYAGKDYNDLKGQMAEGGNIYSKEESMNIARTILQKMGGRARLEAFTGAYNFAIGDGAVMFRIKNRGVNFVKVKLNGSDLYDVTFGRISGTNYKIVEELDDVYAEDLIDIFEKSTGMYLRFDKGGNLSPSDSDSYYRWRMKKFGFKPYGKEKGRFKITYVADGEPQEEITTTKEMAIDTAKRYTKLFEDVKIFDGSGSEIKYEKGGSVGGYTLKDFNPLLDEYDQVVSYKKIGNLKLSQIIGKNHVHERFSFKTEQDRDYWYDVLNEEQKKYFTIKNKKKYLNYILKYNDPYAEKAEDNGITDKDEMLQYFADDIYYELRFHTSREDFLNNLGIKRKMETGGGIFNSEFYKDGGIMAEGGGLGKIKKGSRIYFKGDELIVDTVFSWGNGDVEMISARRKSDNKFVELNKRDAKLISLEPLKKEAESKQEIKKIDTDNLIIFYESGQDESSIYRITDLKGKELYAKWFSSSTPKETKDIVIDLSEKHSWHIYENDNSNTKFHGALVISKGKLNSFDTNSEDWSNKKRELGIEDFADGGNLHSSEFYKDGGEVGFSLKNDTKYVRSEDIQEVRLTNGKKIFNYEKWYGSQRNYGESVDNIFSGLYVAKRPIPSNESKEQYNMFKDGGNLPESAKYIKRSELESVIINDENGEEKEIPANRIVNGIWYDNQRNEALIERAKKEGLLKK